MFVDEYVCECEGGCMNIRARKGVCVYVCVRECVGWAGVDECV